MVNIQQFLEVVEKLRDPQTGCPWDIKQTFDSMIPCLLEETYEVAEAIHTKDHTALREELGDLLLQVVFFSQLAKEEGTFTFQDVLNDIHEKLIYRHPHVFGDKSASSSEEALQNWEAQKAKEKAAKQQQSILDDLPFALPALTRATKLQKRCAKVGFDWDNPQDVLAKVEEELEEVREELYATPVEPEKLAEELGDLLFASVNLCRHHNIDAETCLRNANVKFENRFKLVEKRVKEEGKSLEECSLVELDLIWHQIKTME
ncbi:nucleoside triphosphate pyrophosphohydrolase [Ursidibacter maritimus]|uniref:Nucleoside triphosphate pyrophosphohydrolase n=1 Tax=Ursidibacter maritimus TaxID=1331689 RepID=A0A949T7M1_9PAST|nr:nucleoside triphosphate pyrophosphohydrolase [Ursidibacter maritimus]KAE9539146.1 nucleoside triphosphate pyrophosphohydrolase [Ursidibacter maritimus]MBV6524467.1 nucleoside triphosphate pyrophosphohydrolase [Ursidibacter maritimus]MBV6526158.1 nucleoside triphosphate pyrophosphohydrolase [Ursidibacter maritimus]MBV6527000.1 nucleoside triphosphate pyrophosphohydrolase [Ursidibacter maritimus]MBV6528773.1 nucleoside triphosphate pyrophosphohydrolase [Ursidibacter maritimus]